MAGSNSETIIAVVKRIPKGKVATYGQVARVAGLPRHARLVGTVLRSLPDGSHVPWHRVVNSRGRISVRGHATFEDLQRYILEAEGVEFSNSAHIDLEKYQWSAG